MNMNLATTQKFGNIDCDFWSDDTKGIWMTRKQVGEALEYSEPQKAIDKIHAKRKERLDVFSVTTKLVGTDGKTYDTYLYSARGVFEICRWSRQAKADEFMDWCWEIVDGLRTGKYKLSQNGSKIPYAKMIANLSENQTLIMQELESIKSTTDLNTDSILDLAYKFEDLESEMRERTETFDRLISAKGCLSMNQVAKSLGIGRNTMMEILRNQNVLFLDGKDNIPYEKYSKSGHFIVTSKANRNGEIHAVTKVTAKGVKFVSDLLCDLRKMN